MPKFKPVDMKASFPDMEKEVLAFWDQGDVFRQSVDAEGPDRNGKSFVFYDGPPFATGTPHYGHILASTIKDVVPRFRTMQGYKVERRFGWDTHGLPIEAEMQDRLNLDGPADIKEYGVAKFNEACRDNVLRYTEEWRKTLTRLGRWVDFDNDYKTMDLDFMESVWWVFKQLWDKGLVYKGTKVMPYSWKLATPLSNFEANNYHERTDPSVAVRVKTPAGYLLVWTTTPWTLPSNLAVAVNPNTSYARIQYDGELYFVAEELADVWFKDSVETPSYLVDTCQGTDLIGLQYEPIFPFFKGHKNAFRVLGSDHVTTDTGTGLVHLAPAYGEDDHRVCRAAEIEPVDPVDAEGKFTSAVDLFAGMQVHEANAHIIRRLKVRELLFNTEEYTHQYPFCWRTDTPLIYKAVPVWFISMEKLQEQLVENNKKINWVPGYVGERRFHEWLANTRDWAVSRSRFWGTPIPIYECDSCQYTECLESVADLEARTGREFTDIHPHKIDSEELPCPKCSGDMKRTSEVFDCWFESGAMPFAQNHYPFDCELDGIYPADFIAEGLDQTRGWFYTLLAISTALGMEPPYKNVVVNGILLGPDGKKLSKKLKNYTDPNEIMNQYGADALRAYLISSPAVHAQDMCFQDEGVKAVVKDTLIPLRSAMSFFVQYANADEYDPATAPVTPLSELCDLDRWILSEMSSLVSDVQSHMEAYQLDRVMPCVNKFIDHLNNWYIRKSRRRIWDGDAAAYQTLYDVLTNLSKVIAPFLPFMAEDMFQTLAGYVYKDLGEEPKSVHLHRFPGPHWPRDQQLEQRMVVTRVVSHMGHALREKNKLRTRQPLRKCVIVTSDPDTRDAIQQETDLICDELNVKQVEVHEDDEKLCSLEFKLNYKTIGPRFGNRVKEVVQLINDMRPGNWRWLQREGVLVIANDSITPEDILVTRIANEGVVVETHGDLTIALDTEQDIELQGEGQAREFVSAMQRQRKKIGLDITDRIEVEVQGSFSRPLQWAFDHHQKYIETELLATKFVIHPGGEPPSQSVEVDVDKETVSVSIIKAQA